MIQHAKSFHPKRGIGVVVRLEVSPIPCAVVTFVLRCPNKIHDLKPQNCGYPRALKSVSTSVRWPIPRKVVVNEENSGIVFAGARSHGGARG